MLRLCSKDGTTPSAQQNARCMGGSDLPHAHLEGQGWGTCKRPSAPPVLHPASPPPRPLVPPSSESPEYVQKEEKSQRRDLRPGGGCSVTWILATETIYNSIAYLSKFLMEHDTWSFACLGHMLPYQDSDSYSCLGQGPSLTAPHSTHLAAPSSHMWHLSLSRTAGLRVGFTPHRDSLGSWSSPFSFVCPHIYVKA